jgi:uncharacterized membrane protein YciS (DUF1049 family)
MFILPIALELIFDDIVNLIVVASLIILGIALGVIIGLIQLRNQKKEETAEKEIKRQYHRLEKDDKNFGRIFVHFRYKSAK